MSEKPRPSPEVKDLLLYPEEWKKFEQELLAAGFTDAAPTNGRKRAWAGSVSYSWRDGATEQAATAEVRIELPAGFPFEKPVVFPTGADPVANASHQAPPDMGGWLCLWPEDNTGWHAGTTAHELLDRTRYWYQCHRSGKWAEQDHPPDLHLYFPTPDRKFMIFGEDWQFPAGEQVGRFKIWATRPGIRLLAVRPDSDIQKLPALRGLAPSSEQENGIWFRLKREPVPRQTLNDLLAEIDSAAAVQSGWALQQLKGLLGEKIREENRVCVIALEYPRVNGEAAWLFLRVDIGLTAKNENGKWVRSAVLKGSRLQSYETAAADKSTMTRRTEHLAEQLRGRAAVIFGVGAIGSTVAVLLAKAGIERLLLVDGDTLRPGNTVRHECGLEFVGASKSKAMKLQISYFAPYCRIDVADPTSDPNKLRELIADAGLVIDATANTNFSFLLNEVGLKSGVPVIYVAGHRRAAIGRIRIVRPALDDACLACYDGEGGLVDAGTCPIIPPGPEGEFVETGCGSSTVQASAIDIESTANHAARAAIWLLLGRLDAGNHCLVVNELLPDAAGPLKSLGVSWSFWKRLAGCATCSTLHETVQEKKSATTPAAA